MNSHDIEIDNDSTPIRCESCPQGTKGVLVWSLAAAALLIGATWVNESFDLAQSFKLLIALSPMVPFVGMLVLMVRMSRRLDEMQRRVQLEALGLCVVLASGTCVLIGQLQRIDVLGEINMSMAMVAIVAAYAMSYAFVARRYA
jgi:hypothetical protein